MLLVSRVRKACLDFRNVGIVRERIERLDDKFISVCGNGHELLKNKLCRELRRDIF